MKSCSTCNHCVNTFHLIDYVTSNTPLNSCLKCSHKDFTKVHYDPVKGTYKSFTECELALKRCKFEHYNYQNWFVVKFIAILLTISSLIGYLCFVLNNSCY